MNPVRLYTSYTLTSFYETWLVLLTILCILLLMLERYVSGIKSEVTTKESADDRLENGRSPTSGNALTVLARKYLVVYAIVMGQFSILSGGRDC